MPRPTLVDTRALYSGALYGLHSLPAETLTKFGSLGLVEDDNTMTPEGHRWVRMADRNHAAADNRDRACKGAPTRRSSVAYLASAPGEIPYYAQVCANQNDLPNPRAPWAIGVSNAPPWRLTATDLARLWIEAVASGFVGTLPLSADALADRLLADVRTSADVTPWEVAREVVRLLPGEFPTIAGPHYHAVAQQAARRAHLQVAEEAWLAATEPDFRPRGGYVLAIAADAIAQAMMLD